MSNKEFLEFIQELIKKKPVNVNIENSKYYKKLDYIRTITNKPIII